jgi:glucose 1-dehydrogenase
VLHLQGLEVHVYDRGGRGLKRELVEAMGAHYIWAQERKLGHELAEEIGPVDIVFEATGFSPLAFDAIDMIAPNGIVCLSGVSGGGRSLEVSVDHLNLELVLGNKVVFGTVNANRRHFESGVRHLGEIEARWPGLLSRITTTRLPIEDFAEGVRRAPGDVKKIVELAPVPSGPALKQEANV